MHDRGMADAAVRRERHNIDPEARLKSNLILRGASATIGETD
jgi:hypothetical protein